MCDITKPSQPHQHIAWHNPLLCRVYAQHGVLSCATLVIRRAEVTTLQKNRFDALLSCPCLVSPSLSWSISVLAAPTSITPLSSCRVEFCLCGSGPPTFLLSPLLLSLLTRPSLLSCYDSVRPILYVELLSSRCRSSLYWRYMCHSPVGKLSTTTVRTPMGTTVTAPTGCVIDQ